MNVTLYYMMTHCINSKYMREMQMKFIIMVLLIFQNICNQFRLRGFDRSSRKKHHVFINTFHECQINLWTDSNSIEMLKEEKLFHVRDITRWVVRVAVSVHIYLSTISMLLQLNTFRLEFINSEIIKNESFVAASDLMRYEVTLSNKWASTTNLSIV